MNLQALKNLCSLYKIRFKEVVNGQIILVYGVKRYRLDEMEDGTCNLLEKRDLLNNPTHKNRYKLIGNFTDMNKIIVAIKNRKVA